MYGRMVVCFFFLLVRDDQGRNVSFLRTREYCLWRHPLELGTVRSHLVKKTVQDASCLFL